MTQYCDNPSERYPAPVGIPAGTNGHECPKCGRSHAEIVTVDGMINLRCLNESCGYRWAKSL